MNGRAERKVPLWVKLAAIAYGFVGTLYCLGGMFVRVMGPCPAFSSETDCGWSPFEEFWAFPGAQIAFVLVGIGLIIGIKRWVGR